MRELTESGAMVVTEIADRYGLSQNAVRTVLEALILGGGTQAQFTHHELGGSGQWMQGGMTMVGDMFNHGLKVTVDGVCSELAEKMAFENLVKPMPYVASGATISTHTNWWPGDLGSPVASGSQNNLRYAYFQNEARLAVDFGGKVKVYDTLDHVISGFSQSQSGAETAQFTSQHGLVSLGSLPEVTPKAPAEVKQEESSATIIVKDPEPVASEADVTPASEPVVSEAAVSPISEEVVETAPAPTPTTETAPAPMGNADEILNTIERLADLQQKGILTAEEFAAKKADLLARL